ncbi:MDR family oxidoreductase [Novosphingobium sp. P6W]|uniref:acrylyl-CoA reductase (NADPH) n=1 Tax=Novosphingobium sp. P6W TaxID=1609758 RepID=UPI0005C2E6F8|nr:MDR family oxidoreductase [Novosphingobium sp. P6W]AXB80408.1 oxidoreductase [Novosphingobium sp. P6W]KIS31315.1 NADPH:quinone dehydrogenase [Novosphingobium sp. P6W]
MAFRAILADRTDGAITASVTTVENDILRDGDVTVAVEWSNVNYKDAIAFVSPQIIQTFPLIPGIDFAGRVEHSSDPRFVAGDKVVATGWGLSQTHHGGFAQRAQVKADWLVKLPDPLSTRDAMAIGTAGFTAMLSVLALEDGGIVPQRGDILVTGASGGVGSIAIAILSELGYHVLASTGKASEAEYLRRLGASEIIDRETISSEDKPLGPDRWAGAIDTVGSRTLANVLAQTKYRGVVTACGFVGGFDLPATVMPFIMRNVTLAGIDSVNAPQVVRERAWQRLATDLDLEKLALAVTEIGLEEVLGVAGAMRAGKSRGRSIVDVNR